ncbi:type I-E CRISPR-associated protein Cse1/CasA [Meiothermus sp. CFH 77666]|uniref:type I-E CRISPR-associated protein Cse1/CasA n=1 Tax=Meiothermus sp. CFH 77666 TaxID=2817942 RepID=UPI001AA0771A|nr:type I-E CRISPR-associated protein Cse1/CasA [Meiothermus sp. CFH 77666]
MYSFNLVSEPWIPVRIGGRLELFSLEQTLLCAQKIERLEDASPLVLVALHRLLLAVLYRALQGPKTLEDNLKWIKCGQFPQDLIQMYLNQWKSHFDLFDTKRPFFQVPDLDRADFVNHGKSKPIEPKSWIELSPEIRDGGQAAPIFNHENKVAEPIDAPTAARLLLALQTFALGGLRGGRTFQYSAKRAPSPNAIFVIPHGQNLLETFCYCLDPNNYALLENDIPFWESNPAINIAYLKTQGDKVVEVMGCVQAYTWMSRSVKLIPELAGGELRVSKIYFASGLSPGITPEKYYDPMVGTQLIKSGENKDKYRFTGFVKGRQFWRDFHSLFTPEDSNDRRPPRVISISSRLYNDASPITLGIYGIANPTQEAKIDFARQEFYTLPEAISADRTSEVYSSLEEALKQAEDLGTALDRAIWQLARLVTVRSERKLSDEDRAAINKRAETYPGKMAYWSKLDSVFPKLLLRLTKDYQWQSVRVFWLKQLIEASNHAWNLTQLAVGDDASALKALYVSEQILREAQNPILQQLKEAKEAV